ncbi:uncharacterized protein CEXT_478421 [Caerostris extrusa]|uniref:Uncharacterized protein n=1 Tax=Caerostris extrusa TaxID=172846 RepID=A0AAV4UJB6_CAEEX|nr:uncharacterized protein CEXT_478421 [Caerostris extrusa]
MKVSIFLIIVLVGESVAFLRDRCDRTKCFDESPMKELYQVLFMPSKDQLLRLCPKILEYVACEFDTIKICVGQSLEDLATSSNRSVASFSSGLLGVRGLLRDVCDEESTLHKDYVAEIDCYRRYVAFGSMLCVDEARSVTNDFMDTVENLIDHDTGNVNDELQCLRAAYDLACRANELKDFCGVRAQKAFVNIFRRMKGVLGEIFCPNDGDFTHLRQKFLDTMNLQANERNRIEEIFDLFENRR